MHHAVRWFLQESPSGSTHAPSVVAMTARMLATGRETVSPPVPASRTVRLSNRQPRKTDSLCQQRTSCYSKIYSPWWLIISTPPCWSHLCSWTCQWYIQTQKMICNFKNSSFLGDRAEQEPKKLLKTPKAIRRDQMSSNKDFSSEISAIVMRPTEYITLMDKAGPLSGLSCILER